MINLWVYLGGGILGGFFGFALGWWRGGLAMMRLLAREDAHQAAIARKKQSKTVLRWRGRTEVYWLARALMPAADAYERTLGAEEVDPVLVTELAAHGVPADHLLHLMRHEPRGCEARMTAIRLRVLHLMRHEPRGCEARMTAIRLRDNVEAAGNEQGEPETDTDDDAG